MGQSTTGNIGNQAYTHSDGVTGNSKSLFTYEELGDATDNFAYKNILGEGGFGCVYRGVLYDKREVAVKELKAGSGQGEREFRAEVDIISRVHHRHLVSLVGYCIVDNHRLLVYDYVPNGTLHCHLHGQFIYLLFLSLILEFSISICYIWNIQFIYRERRTSYGLGN